MKQNYMQELLKKYGRNKKTEKRNMMKLLQDHSCYLIKENEEIAVEKYENNGKEKWFLNIGNQLSEIRYCPYCGKGLKK